MNRAVDCSVSLNNHRKTRLTRVKTGTAYKIYTLIVSIRKKRVHRAICRQIEWLIKLQMQFENQHFIKLMVTIDYFMIISLS